MATTSYTDPATAWAAYALQDRTDESGSAVDDLNGEDMRIVLEAFTAGVLSTNAFQVREDSPTPGMTVRVGSGSAKADVAILEGTEAGQGKYMVRLGDAATTVTVPAANVSNPRIDEVYVVVQDDPYDSNGANTVPRIGYRQGDAASNPSAPGPDGSWTAYLKLASIDVGAGVTEIEAGDITDERVMAGLAEDIVAATDSIPKGVLGYAFRTSSFTISSDGIVDLPGLSVQVTVPAGRLIRVVGYVTRWDGSMTQGDEADFLVREGIAPLSFKNLVAAKNGRAEGGAVEALIRPSAGTHTYKLSFERSESSNWTGLASSFSPAYILVEDLGADPNA